MKDQILAGLIGTALYTLAFGSPMPAIAQSQSQTDKEIGITTIAISINLPTVNDTYQMLKTLYPTESATYLWQIAEWVHNRRCTPAPSGQRDESTVQNRCK